MSRMPVLMVAGRNYSVLAWIEADATAQLKREDGALRHHRRESFTRALSFVLNNAGHFFMKREYNNEFITVLGVDRLLE